MAVDSMRKYIREAHDIDRRELKLIRVGHYLWARYKKERGKSGPLSEQRALETALRQVWELKKELRVQVKAERAVKAALVRERFRAKCVGASA
jgi:hypothetical protein